jgi:hypothetical protein
MAEELDNVLLLAPLAGDTTNGPKNPKEKTMTYVMESQESLNFPMRSSL